MENRPVPKQTVTLAVASLLAFAAASCSILDRWRGSGAVAEAHTVVGEVSIVRDGKTHRLSAGAALKPHDAFTVRVASKLRVTCGQADALVNGGSAFRLLPPTEAESCVVAAERGDYYLRVPDGGRPLSCHFGDMVIGIAAGTDAALAIDASGRLAEFFVLGGRALVKRGAELKRVSSCEAVVLDAAGISEDEAVTAGRAAAAGRLRGWVGEKAVAGALDRGGCKLDAEEAPADNPAPATVPAPRATPSPAPVAAPMPVAQAAPPPADTTKPAAPPQPPQPPQPADGFLIEHIIGPSKIFAGEEFSLKCGIAGRAAVTSYMWRFDGAGDLLAVKTDIPQVTATLEKTGEFVVTCEVMGDAGLLATQAVKVNVVPGQVAVSAGGPYKAMLNKPVKLLGNAKSRKGKITQYEWYLTHSGRPDYVLFENAAISHAFPKSGDHKAVFAARLADGTAASDTATVSVGSLRPVANAGAAVVPRSNGKAKLNGTGSSPDGKIVKYEWDFDGDGAFDWRSELSGQAEHVFKAFATPVLRVTDAEGNTAEDTTRVVICPKDMATVESGKFCVDRHEWPNQRGAVPLTNVSWREAATACEGAGKRLCAPDEWKRACRNGGEHKPADGNSYPYGDAFDDNKCNTLGNPKSKNALMPSGALGECAGALGVYDMSGNAAEWTASNTGKAQAFGGFYQSGAEESGCESNVTLDKDKQYLYTGFRCCK
jgi:roadblock/LC7 domain-containing protein